MTTPLISGSTYTFNNNLVVNQNISAPNVGNISNFKNRIINGDMRVDQRGDDGATATGALTGSYLTYKVPPPSYYTVDRFAISAPNIGNPVAKKVTLSTTDTTTTGGFTTATQISSVPVDSLMAYFPLDGNLTDTSGNSVSLTSTGTIQYVPSAVVGTQSLYLANEANVTAGTAAANYITCPNFVFPQSFSVSMWVLNRGTGSAFAVRDTFIFITNTGSSTLTNAFGVYIVANTGVISATQYGVNSIPGYTPVLFEWSHVIVTYNLGTYQHFVNGISRGTNTFTTALAQAGFMLGNSGTTYTQAFAGFIDDFRIYNRVLGPSEIAALATNVGIPVPPIADASWITQITLDNTIVDSRGGLPDPVRTGNTVFTPVCKTGAFSMDLTANSGTQGAASTALTYTLSSGSYNVPLTLMAWINVKATTNIQIPVAISNNSSADTASLQFYVYNGKYVFDVYVGGAYYSHVSIGTINPGTWYHIAIVATSTTSTSGYNNAYVNGILIASRTIPAGSLGIAGGTGTPNQLRIGAKGGSSFLFNFQGFIDDVRIYNRALTSREIAGIYATSQYASYTLFKQPIEANNLRDLAWGTSSALPVTGSMWIKNNTSSAQSFSVSLQNAGANLIAWIPFENGSVNDVLGFLNNSSNYATPLSTSVYKVGTASLDLSANTLGGTMITNRRVDYNVPFALQLPLTISCWLYSITPIGGGGIYQVPFCLGSVSDSGWTLICAIDPSGRLYFDNAINNVQYTTPITDKMILSANTWYHICITYGYGLITLYFNGINMSQVICPSNGVPTYNTLGLISLLRIGHITNRSLNQPFKGYIDDFRMYNVALSQASVAQLYTNNAKTTTSSSYLLPRSVVYNTPSIPANSWQKISFTVPGETTSSFLPNNDTGLTLAVCLGATDFYNTANLASSTNNTSAVWSSMADYMGASNQLYGISDSNFLAYVTNSILITGVQLERGTLATPFEYRPYGTESLLTQRYYQQIGGTYPATVASGFVRATTAFVGLIPIQRPMRTNVLMTTTPGISLNISQGGGDATVTSISTLGSTVPTYYTSTNIATTYFNASGLTAGLGGLITINSPGKVFLIFDAEL